MMEEETSVHEGREKCESMVVVGCVLSEKKKRHLRFPELSKTAARWGLSLVPLSIADLHANCDDGPFSIIVHKVTDVTSRAQEGCKEAQQLMGSFEKFLAAQAPDCVVIDDLTSTYRLLDRMAIEEALHTWHLDVRCDNALLQKRDGEVDSSHRLSGVERERGNQKKGAVSDVWTVETPHTTFHSTKEDFVASLKDGTVTLPVILKSRVAHGSRRAHEMALVADAALSAHDLDLLEKLQYPIVAQQFIPHGGVLVKAFVIGKEVSVSCRPSVRDGLVESQHVQRSRASAQLGQKTQGSVVYFDSHDVSKASSESPLNEAGALEGLRADDVIPTHVVAKAAEALADIFHLSLIGLDIVVERHQRKAFVVDVNYFPGYREMPCFHEKLCAFLREQLIQQQPSVGEPANV